MKKIVVTDEGEVKDRLHQYWFEPSLPESYATRAMFIFGWRRGAQLVMKSGKLAGVVGHPDDLRDFLKVK